MEVRANCSCGQHFAFDIEPENAQMPYAIACPECDADLTASANEYLASVLDAPPAAPMVEQIATPVEAVEENPAVVEEPAAEVEPKPKKKKRKKKKGKATKKSGPNLVFAVIGGMVGGLIGMAIWYALARYANINVGWVAWGVGGLVGFGALMGADEHSDVVGVMAALIAAGSILLGQYLAIKGSIADTFGEMISDSAFEEQVDFAKRVVAAKDDEGLKKVLTQQWGEAASDNDVAEFRSESMPRMKKLASGEITKDDMMEELSVVISPWVIFKESFDLFTIIFICLGMATAYKLPSGNMES